MAYSKLFGLTELPMDDVQMLLAYKQFYSLSDLYIAATHCLSRLLLTLFLASSFQNASSSRHPSSG